MPLPSGHVRRPHSRRGHHSLQSVVRVHRCQIWKVRMGTSKKPEFWVGQMALLGLPRWLNGKESACQCRRCRFDPCIRKIPWSRKWHPTPVLLPGKSHGWRSLVGCSPWGRQESGTTERLHFDFSLSCIGEGNGNPLQYSCLENPRNGEPSGLLSMGSHKVGHD